MRALATLLSALVLIVVPGLTVWLASSLVAFHGGPRELALVGGLLLFPVLPVLWEWRASRAFRLAVSRRRQFAGAPKRALSLVTRLSLRTLLVCLAFTGGMVARFPKTAFAALATRGDWFLPPGEAGEPWRRAVFATAGGLEGLHRWAHPNPYLSDADRAALAQVDTTPSGDTARWRRLTDEERAQSARPAPEDAAPSDTAPAPSGTAPPPDEATPPPPPPVMGSDGTHWPWTKEISATVRGMQPHDESSLASVAQYIRSREPEPFGRLKALHDWVVTRLEYDHASTKPGQRKPQDAASVFLSRVAVCEGYARTLVELGRLTGDRVVLIGGEVREGDGAAASVLHAWNAAEVDGRWYLIDATWDDPVGPDNTSRSYRTDYLFIPPSIAIWSHFPEDARWQLLEAPLSRGDFLRQPFVHPGIARDRLTVRSPSRSAVDVRDEVLFEVDNPLRRFLLVQYRSADGRALECGESDAELVRVACPVGSSGKAVLLSNEQRYGEFSEVMSVTVTRR